MKSETKGKLCIFYVYYVFLVTMIDRETSGEL